MKIVIAGTRYKDPENKIPFDDYQLIIQSIRRSGYNITEVVSGTAIGVDRLGEVWGRANNIPVKEMPANWNRYGKKAGMIRNKNMAEYCDAAIIIWDGESRGTRNMIDNMIKQKKPYYIGMTAKTTLDDFL